MIKIAYPVPSASAHLKTQDNTVGVSSDEIGMFKANYTLTMRQKNILQELKEFYTPKILSNVLLPILTQNSTVSLRAIDWLVTNYSKKNNIVLKNDDELFNIHNGYKVALSYFRRRNFDPFRRRLRITFEFESKVYTTTVGQLNFLKWAYKHNVLLYATDNIKDIEKDMQTVALHHKNEKKKTQYKRKELSRPPSRKVSIYAHNQVVKFE